MMKPHPEIFPWFLGTWVALAVLGFYFNATKDVRWKRRVMPFSVVGVGVLFLVFTVLISGDLRVIGFLAPFVALISYLNINNTKFCDSCGKTVFNQMWFTKIEYCAKCGAKLP